MHQNHHTKQTFLSFVAIDFDLMPTRSFHSASRLKTFDSGTINRAQATARVLAVRQLPFASLFAVLLDRLSTAGHLGCVATGWHHFVNKLGARAARLVALALAEVTTGQRFLAVFTANDFFWVLVALHGK
jgi:hypothetical protein